MNKYRRKLQRGLTLIELMIAMTLGILIVGGMATLFIQNKNSYRQDERIARMQEDARFALNTIVDDIELAGFWSNLFTASSIVVNADTDIGQDCGDGTVGWMYELNQAVTSYDKPTNASSPTDTFECLDSAEYQANTDAIFIKRVEGTPMESKDATQNFDDILDQEIYLLTNGVIGVLLHGNVTPDVSVTGDHWKYLPRLYYVRNYANSAGDGIPTLCRYYLSYDAATPGMTEECIAQGVENLQIEYGIDTNNDAVADRYLSNPTAAQLSAQLVSVRVHMLFRTLEEDPIYTNTKTYTIGNYTYDPPDDGYYRRTFTTTVLLRNNRNQICLQNGCP